MLYTLIIMTALLPERYDGGGNMGGFAVHGFKNEASCIKAGNKLQIPGNTHWHETKAICKCVAMGE